MLKDFYDVVHKSSPESTSEVFILLNTRSDDMEKILLQNSSEIMLWSNDISKTHRCIDERPTFEKGFTDILSRKKFPDIYLQGFLHHECPPCTHS